MVRFKIQDASQSPEDFLSRAYTVRTTCACHVSPEGDDDLGSGRPEDPYATITKALAQASGVPQAHAWIRVQEGMYNENVVMKPFVDITGGYNSDWRRGSRSSTVLVGVLAPGGLEPTVTGANDARIENMTLTSPTEYDPQTGEPVNLFGQIVCENTSPVIQDCVIDFGKGSMREMGGAISCRGPSCEPKIRRCRLLNNAEL